MGTLYAYCFWRIRIWIQIRVTQGSDHSDSLNFRLPIDVNNCSATDMVRVRHLRTPRGKADKDQEFISGVNFDPRKYLKKKK